MVKKRVRVGIATKIKFSHALNHREFLRIFVKQNAALR